MFNKIALLAILVSVFVVTSVQAKTTTERYLDEAAQLDAHKDLSISPKPGYAWTKNYCYRHNTRHPNLLIIGDSIFDGWSGYLLHEFPRALIDAKVGRQFYSAIPLYDYWKRYPITRKVSRIVLELGTNGAVTPTEVMEFMKLAGKRYVYLITPSVPRPWQNEVLSVYHWAAKVYPNVRLVHFHKLAEGHLRWFWPDQVHPNWRGIQEEVRALKESLGTNRKANLR